RVAGVFHYDQGRRYSLSFPEARRACAEVFGAALASRQQLATAMRAGMEDCRAGWLAAREVAYPRIHATWRCGQHRTGIISYGVRNASTERWDVFCYGFGDDTCGGVLAWTRAGEIRSPGFPRAYPSGADCTWEVRAPPEFTLRLAVQALGLEERRHCDYDSLGVYDGTGAGRRLLGRFCGFKLPLPLLSSGNSLTLVLKSDASVEHEGFSAKLTLVKLKIHNNKDLNYTYT
uniref:CUB domain-containing protein n=1 Tax=Petromyzon marinus TaxID=7757 RepID=S4RSC8_PETMA